MNYASASVVDWNCFGVDKVQPSPPRGMLGCMPAASKPPLLQMHTVVIQPLTADDVGSISCRPMGMEPIDFDWGSRASTLDLDATRSEARRVPPGRYRIRATDANGDRADVVVDLEPTYDRAAVITEYRVSPASTSFSRDGEVTAVGLGLTLPNLRFLWTTGVETDVPRLQDVPCGVYCVTAVVRDDEGGAGVTTIHKCAPAQVGVA